MSGILEQCMAKMDVMIEALNENTKARLAGSDGAAAAATDKPKATRAKADKPTETTGPKTTEAELVAKFEEIKGTDTEKRMPALKKIIADQGFASLKELRMTPAKYDATMAALTAYEATLGGAAEDDDDL